MSRIFTQPDELTLVCKNCGEEEEIPSEFLGHPFEWVLFIETREAKHKNCVRRSCSLPAVAFQASL